MRSWLVLLGGLLVWAFHFFVLYAVGSVFLTTDLARGLTIALTLICLVAVGLVGRRAWLAGPSDAEGDWIRMVGLWGVALSAIAILWQGLVALLI
jgi:hypothetical protein